MIKHIVSIALLLNVASIYSASTSYAANACSNGKPFLSGNCEIKGKGLSSLFRSNNDNSSNPPSFMKQKDTSFFLPYSREVQDIEKVTTSSIKPVSLQRRETIRVIPQQPKLAPLDENAPHQLPVYQGASDILIFKSKNKQLSKGSHDGHAILMMRCKAGQLNVLLDFPGYPMSNTKDQKLVYYQHDYGSSKIGFASSDQLSVVGLWQSGQASQFASEVLNSNKLKVSVKDTENNSITAKFNLSSEKLKTESFSKRCGIG